MRIPDNTIYPSRYRTYGTQGLSMDGIAEEPGCPRLYRIKYEERALHEPSSYALEYGSLVHDALFLNEEEDLPLLPDALDEAIRRSDLPMGPDAYAEAVADLTKYMERREDNLATIAVEQELKAPLIEIDGVQYYFGGFIDKLAIDPDDPTTLYVIDYKTNRNPPSQATVDSDNQMTHYAALVRANLHRYMPGVDPETIRIVVIFDAIKWYPLYTDRPHWQMDQYLDWLKAMVRRIVTDTDGLPVLNPSCSWCPARFDCPEFNKLPGEGDTLADRMSKTTDLEQRVLLAQRAEATIKALKPMIDDVMEEVRQKVEAGAPVVFGGVAYEAKDSWATDWNVRKLYDVLGFEFWNVVTVGKGKVEAVLRRRPELKLDVDACFVRFPKERKQITKKRAED